MESVYSALVDALAVKHWLLLSYDWLPRWLLLLWLPQWLLLLRLPTCDTVRLT
jgi:hypothetical protein